MHRKRTNGKRDQHPKTNLIKTSYQKKKSGLIQTAANGSPPKTITVSGGNKEYNPGVCPHGSC